MDASLARRMRQGEILELRPRDGRATAWRGERAVGALPQVESERVLGLLSGGARLGCRVVLADPAGGVVRVRLSVLM
ncbi:hypothetical protein [Fundidesulfovibrio magnetotacticus]|uniref:hypothetical protein n=1 Tax=Fundidesulfovibrio magnetotacticus TaxID=2730080 RepID=UPI001562F13F|nr:hypothetical protein [Fundidesulfovibrio magnetotacticus]